MTRYITTGIILAGVAATLVFGQLFIKNSCDSVIAAIDRASAAIEGSDYENAKENIGKAIRQLEKNEKLHFALSDHEAYDELSANLKVSKYFAAHSENSLAGAYMTLARDTAEKLKDSQSFGIGNIL